MMGAEELLWLGEQCRTWVCRLLVVNNIHRHDAVPGNAGTRPAFRPKVAVYILSSDSLVSLPSPVSRACGPN